MQRFVAHWVEFRHDYLSRQLLNSLDADPYTTSLLGCFLYHDAFIERFLVLQVGPIYPRDDRFRRTACMFIYRIRATDGTMLSLTDLISRAPRAPSRISGFVSSVAADTFSILTPINLNQTPLSLSVGTSLLQRGGTGSQLPT